MTFDDAVEALDALCGKRVEATIWGTTDGSHSLASLVGEMKRVEPPEELPPELEDAVVITAVVFGFGPDPVNHMNLWPDRFLRASRLQHGAGVRVVTRDGVYRISERRPWID